MKDLIYLAKESATNSDGFLNGLFKGAIVSAAAIVTFVFLTGYVA